MSDNHLKSIIERILRLHAEEEEIAADRREVYAEAKANGYDKTALGEAVRIIRRREKDREAFDERNAIVDLYLSAYQQPSHTYARAHAREATEYPATSPQPGRDPQSGDHGSDSVGGMGGEGRNPCSVEGCEKLERTRGFCAAHYARFLRHGDPVGGSTSIGAAIDFYRREVLGFAGDECLIWPFSRGGNGYGQLTIDGETRTVSRLACEETYGPAPTSKHESAHSCGGGHLGCVNPKHLRWATRSENQGDRVRHGTDSRGEKSATAKLSEGDVKEIIASTLNIAELSERFGVSQSQISRVRNGQQWAHVEPGSEGAASGGERVTPLPETRPAVTRKPTAPIDLTIPAFLDRRPKPQAVA